MSIDKKIHEMGQVIRQTKEYQQVQQMKKMIARKPDIYERLRQLQDAQYQLTKSKMTKEEQTVKFQELQKEFSAIESQPEVRRYLQSLMQLNQRIQFINQCIYEDLQEDLKI